VTGGLTLYWHAEFLNDDTHDPACCEVRQFFSWQNGPPKDHPQFQPPDKFQPNTFYEDSDAAGNHYGRRSGIDSQLGRGHGWMDWYSGNEYWGADTPSIHHHDIYSFKLKVVDVCNGDQVLLETRPIHLEF
jgi:hypothetical protein